MAKLEQLTPEQEALIPVIRDRAIDRALFDKPEVDVERARAATNWLYEKAGLVAPKYFIHVSSPLALQYTANLLKNVQGDQVRAQVGDQVRDQVRAQVGAQVGDQVGDQVRAQVGAQVWDQVRAQVWDQVWDQVRDQVRAQVRDQVRDQVRAQVGDQVGDQVWDQVGDQVRDQVRAQVGAQVWDQVGAQVRAQVGAQVWDQVRAQVWDQVWDQVRDQKLTPYSWAWTGLAWDAYWFPFGEYFKEIGVLDHEDFNRYAEVLESGIFMALQFENCAIVCERPKFVHRNDEHALHYDQGAAIGWNDGYELYYLHGVNFDKELYTKVINRELTISDMLKDIPDADKRSVALMMTEPKKLLKHLNAKLVSTSTKPTRAKEPTKLYEVPNFMDTGDTEYAMTMYCPSTGRPFLEWVEPSIGKQRDADLAQAAAFGISKEQYMAIAPGDEA